MESGATKIIYILVTIFVLFIGFVYVAENPVKVQSFINNNKNISFDWFTEHNIKGEEIIQDDVYVDKYGNIYYDNIKQNTIEKSDDYIYDSNGNIILSKAELSDQINYVVDQEVVKARLQIHNDTTPKTMLRVDAPQYDIINFYCNNETAPLFNYTIQFMFEDEKDTYDLNFQEFCEYMRLYKK